MITLSPETTLLASLAIGVVPLLIVIGTCYLKFSIVLSMLRSGFGTQQAPSASLVAGLSMVLSLTVMQPIITETAKRFSSIRSGDLRGGMLKVLSQHGEDLMAPWISFLRRNSGQRELETFHSLSSGEVASHVRVDDTTTLNVATVLGAFVLSEIKNGFIIAFMLLIPFFVLDLIVGNLLISMGLTMMSPSTVGLPLKILLFISSDAWLLLAKSLISTYRG